MDAAKTAGEDPARKIQLAWSAGRDAARREGPSAAPTLRAVCDAADCDQLFEELHGRAITVGRHRCRIRVYGICEDAGWRFLQLALTGSSGRKLTLRASARHDATSVIRKISLWLLQPSEAQDVLSVA
jgi:hypothetical protein